LLRSRVRGFFFSLLLGNGDLLLERLCRLRDFFLCLGFLFGLNLRGFLGLGFSFLLRLGFFGSFFGFFGSLAK
jgi:hypothetical protein